MQKKRLYGIFILGLLLSVSLIGFVTAQGFFDDPWAYISQGFNSGSGFGDGFSRFLFGVVIAVLVYAVTDKLPGMNKESMTWARVVISIIVAYFGTVFLNATELLALISTYSALGFALGAILPFLILIFFSYDILSSTNIKNTWVRVWTVRVTWIFFGVFLLIRIISLSGAGSAVAGAAAWIKPGHWLLLAVTLFVIVGVNYARKKLDAGREQSTQENAAAAGDSAAAEIEVLDRMARRTGDSRA